MIELTRAAAQRMLLAAQGLLCRPEHAATKADVLAMIRQMGALQIDTIHVVARSPYLVLWSRLGDYAPRWLDELLAEGALFEYWSHEACFLPIEDYPLYRRMMLEGIARRWAYVQSWMDANHEGVAQLVDHIRANGPVRSADFKRTDGQTGGWWNWKWEKRALEMLYTSGQLMIARRERFHRIYDLRERVLPDWDDARTPSLEETRRALALRAVHALGVTPAGWVADYFRTSKRETVPVVEQLAAEGLLLPARVEGWKEPAYVHPDHAAHAEAAAAGGLQPKLTTLLSPFDPLVWDRKRALDLFDFDYRIECYTPAPRRRYGYFTLPILHRGALVGRLDPKAHRKDGVFEVKALHLEPGVVVDDELIMALAGALMECAAWHGTPDVVVRQSDPPKLAAALHKAAGAQNAKRRTRDARIQRS